MNNFKETFANYTSEYLLKKRALGDDLADEAHKAIEEIFAERGEILPPKPSRPVDVKLENKFRSIEYEYVRYIFIFILFLFAEHFIVHSGIGVIGWFILITYMIVKWVRSNSLSEEDKIKLKEQKTIKKDGLNELMVAAAKGDIKRVNDLIDYNSDVNAKSYNGSTALMYAAHNNHVDIAKKLIDSGANIALLNNKKYSALIIAKKQGHHEMIDLLKCHGAG